MRRLPIADCRLPIADSSIRRCFTRRRHNCGKVVRLLHNCGQLACGDNSRFSKKFEPESGFVGLFFESSDFCNKLGLASGPASCPIVCRDRSAAANDLILYHSSGFVRFRDCSRKLNYPKRKVFGALFQFGGVHTPKVLEQSPIANRQSSISV